MASTELPNPSRFFGFLDHKNYRFKPNSVRVMDQHHKAFHHLRREKPSWLIHVDAHHDLGYPRHEKLRSEHNWDVLDSGNWVRKLVEAGSLGKLTLIYPHWRRRLSFQSSVENAEHVKNLLLLKERGVEVEVLYGLDNLPDDLHVHATAICRSSAWTPPWLDDDFNSLVQSFRKVGSNALEETGRRRFDYDALTQHVSVIRCIKRPLIDAVHALPLPLASS